jgi:hypothetical protein
MRKPSLEWRSLILPAATHIVATTLGKSCQEIWKIPLQITVWEEASRISDDIYDQVIEQLKTSSFALEIDEATNVVKDKHLICYAILLLVQLCHWNFSI